MPGIECNQCGFFHPPLKEGEKCPMATGGQVEGKKEIRNGKDA